MSDNVIINPSLTDSETADRRVGRKKRIRGKILARVKDRITLGGVTPVIVNPTLAQSELSEEYKERAKTAAEALVRHVGKKVKRLFTVRAKAQAILQRLNRKDDGEFEIRFGNKLSEMSADCPAFHRGVKAYSRMINAKLDKDIEDWKAQERVDELYGKKSLEALARHHDGEEQKHYQRMRSARNGKARAHHRQQAAMHRAMFNHAMKLIDKREDNRDEPRKGLA